MSKYKKIPGVEYSIDRRWEKGIPHHPKSEALMKKIAALDYEFQHDSFGWEMGGDGDNGESLMFLLDIVFDEQDATRRKARKQRSKP